MGLHVFAAADFAVQLEERLLAGSVAETLRTDWGRWLAACRPPGTDQWLRLARRCTYMGRNRRRQTQGVLRLEPVEAVGELRVASPRRTWGFLGSDEVEAVEQLVAQANEVLRIMFHRHSECAHET